MQKLEKYVIFNIMRLENYPIQKLKKELLEIIGKYLDLSKHRVFFFGSRVTGKGNERSDIDVGIEGPYRIPGAIMENIREDVDALPTMYTIQIVDFKFVSDEFYKTAKNNLEVIRE